MVQQFKTFLKESKGFSGTVYHGTAGKFDEFSQDKARVFNDFFGGGVAYFTSDLNVAITYAKAARKRSREGIGRIYTCSVTFEKTFDVDSKFTGKDLLDILPEGRKEREEFARGAGILGGANRDDMYTTLVRLDQGKLSLTGKQVFDGLSRGMVNTAKTRDYLKKKGYDSLRYNGGENMGMKRHDVYIAYYAKDIQIEKRQRIKSPEKAMA